MTCITWTAVDKHHVISYERWLGKKITYVLTEWAVDDVSSTYEKLKPFLYQCCSSVYMNVAAVRICQLFLWLVSNFDVYNTINGVDVHLWTTLVYYELITLTVVIKEIQVRGMLLNCTFFNLSQELHPLSNNFLPETLKAQPRCVNYICTANQSAHMLLQAKRETCWCCRLKG